LTFFPLSFSKKSLKRSSKGDPFGIIGVWSLDISLTVVDVVIFTTAGLTDSAKSAKLSGILEKV
jgi:hypothetical protein